MDVRRESETAPMKNGTTIERKPDRGAADAMSETFEQLDELLVTLGARAIR